MIIFLKKAFMVGMILLISCGDERSNFLGWDTRFKIMNTRDTDYFYCISYSYPQLKLIENFYSTRQTVKAKSTDIYTLQCCWEELLMECCDSHMILNFFTKENYEKNNWETIRDQNLIDTQMIFTIDQLDSLDWLVKL